MRMAVDVLSVSVVRSRGGAADVVFAIGKICAMLADRVCKHAGGVVHVGPFASQASSCNVWLRTE